MASNHATRRRKAIRGRRVHFYRRLLCEPLESRRLLTGYTGPALQLDGVDDYATAPDHASFDLGVGSTDDFTIEASVYVPNASYSGNKTLVYKQNAYALFFNQNGLFLRLWNSPVSTDYVTFSTSDTLSVGWHHIAAVFDNEYTASEDRVAIYLDGNLAESSTAVEWTPGINNSTSALNAAGALGINALEGWMDEVRLSNMVRYSGTSYTEPSAPFSDDADTRALWTFDDFQSPPTGYEFLDASGNGSALLARNSVQPDEPPGGDRTQRTVANVTINDLLLTDADAWTAMFVVTVDFSEAMNPAAMAAVTFAPAVSSTLTLNAAQSRWSDADTCVANGNVTDANAEVADQWQRP